MRALALIILVSAASLYSEDATKNNALFNGKDLKGWDASSATEWSVAGEILFSEGSKDSWLRTEKEYSDFVLKFEYRLASGANSGVSLRCPPNGDPAHDSLEVQLLDDGNPLYKNLKAEQHTGAIYMQAAARMKAALPAGEWNRCEIACSGAEVIVRINDVEVNRVNLKAHKVGKDGRTALSARPLSGVIALEARGGRVEFKKMTIDAK